MIPIGKLRTKGLDPQIHNSTAKRTAVEADTFLDHRHREKRLHFPLSTMLVIKKRIHIQSSTKSPDKKNKTSTIMVPNFPPTTGT